MTPEQRTLARHALGLGAKKRKSYRNRFVTGTGSRDHPAWMQMVEAGEAWRGRGNEITGHMDFFALTLDGARASLAPGESMCSEDFPKQSRKSAKVTT
jgi:hypothetical protein